ncbi:hypothetical protein JTE90_005523 [Oedothorax gibbosus]|uniref:Gustatory receptor n=1 Tax=Oedothorax gibbosus TaxID=931172 RepID=A0AAV6VAU9_9ARAC|nr:hypothetical protein JTE90_005523 [Oedothorax gibbosus]
MIYFPTLIPREEKAQYLYLVLFCIDYTYLFSLITGGFIFLICKNIYKAIGDIVNAYRVKLKRRILSNVPWTITAMSNDISFFKSIILMVSEVEEAFGILVLLLYATIMCVFFNTVSVMLQQSHTFLKAPATIIYNIGNFLTATITVIQMSHYGSHIASQIQCLKREMVVCSDKFIRSSPPKSTMDVFHYLFEIVMKSQIEVTGYGLFVINYSLILAIVSTMITYSVLILQLDNKK